MYNYTQLYTTMHKTTLLQLQNFTIIQLYMNLHNITTLYKTLQHSFKQTLHSYIHFYRIHSIDMFLQYMCTKHYTTSDFTHTPTQQYETAQHFYKAYNILEILSNFYFTTHYTTVHNSQNLTKHHKTLQHYTIVLRNCTQLLQYYTLPYATLQNFTKGFYTALQNSTQILQNSTQLYKPFYTFTKAS